jgi:hypothetical protein
VVPPKRMSELEERVWVARTELGLREVGDADGDDVPLGQRPLVRGQVLGGVNHCGVIVKD